MTEWVIAGPDDRNDWGEGEQLYWSNDIGWVSRDCATVFPHTDFNLPTFGMEGIDVRWEVNGLVSYKTRDTRKGTDYGI